MSLEDKQRWDDKYRNVALPQNIIEVVNDYAKDAKGTLALDIACGMGRNAKLLAKMGFKVDALDIAEIAIESLMGIENINAKVVDFDEYSLKEDAYDLIVCTYFLERKLFPQIKKALKKEAVLIFETFMHHEKNAKVPSNRAFLLEQGELESFFQEGFKILHHKEFMKDNICGEQSMRVSLVVRKL